MGAAAAGGPAQPPTPQGVVYGSPQGIAAAQRRTAPPSPPSMAYPVEEEESGGAGPWAWVAAVLGVLVLLAGGVLLFLLLSGRPPGASPGASGVIIEVPSYVGLPLVDARRNAQGQGFVLSVSAYQSTDAAPEGSVISQDPTAGTKALKGSEVSVIVATQKQTVPVPDLRLHTEADVFDILAQNNLPPGERSEAYDPDVPADLVIRTNPRAGVNVARGTPIDYVISLGPAPTPTPTPTLAPVTLPPTEQPTPIATIVIIPTPEPPTPPPPTPEPTPTPTPVPPPPTDPPTPAPTPVTVGNYSTCGTLGEAKAQIAAAGLQFGGAFPYEATDDWQVAQQYPVAGTQVEPGTYVYLYVKAPADVCP
jgi:beta-lactam-binding protein with PASTA domain